MLETYLNDVFGEKIIINEVQETKHIPSYLLGLYDFFECDFQGIKHTLLLSKDNKIIISKIEKHLTILKSISVNNPVLVVKNLRRETRSKLVKARIPFIDINKQIYIPYMCLLIDDSVPVNTVKIEKFTPSTQMIFISLLQQDTREIESTLLQEKYKISAMTVSRALRELSNAQLLIEKGYNTRKTYETINKKEFWEKGKNYLINPIWLKIYVDEIRMKFLYSSDSALGNITMLNETKRKTFAIDKKNKYLLNDFYVMDGDPDEDSNCAIVELWNYDPVLLSEDNVNVDVYSLYSIFKDSDDPRIEIELEELLERKIE